MKRKYDPDFSQLLKVLRCEKPDRPVLFEYFMNGDLFTYLTGKNYALAIEGDEQVKIIIEAFINAGYDYVTVPARYFGDLKFQTATHDTKATTSQNEGFLITNRATFEAYPWPDPERGDFGLFDRLQSYLKPGMKFIVPGPGGLLENVINLTGFENLCFMFFEDEELVKDIFDSVGSRLLRFYEKYSQIELVGALIVNDDWGFKTQTMFDPDTLRQYVFPWHKKMVEAIHHESKPAILHSCGNLAAIMDDIIDDLKYDAKHSYEDAILPVEQAYEKWGNRIAILGGIDIDFLVRRNPQEITERAKALLVQTSCKGYALGSGNSIPPYIPVENYMAMIQSFDDPKVVPLNN